jgi:L-asparaginase/Glu-tRNA(Gln) amidotransferase subunit D
MMNAEPGDPKREYVGFIRIAGQPEIQLRLMASSSTEARAIVIEQYGEGHVISTWNEEDARRPR